MGEGRFPGCAMVGLDDECGGAGGDGFGEVAAAIDGEAGDGDEAVAGGDCAGVLADGSGGGGGWVAGDDAVGGMLEQLGEWFGHSWVVSGWMRAAGCQAACKPGSVPPLGGGGHPSDAAVARGVQATYPETARDARAARGPRSPYLVLLRAGLAQPAGLPAAGALLPHHFTLTAPAGRGGGMFLWRFPSGCPAWELPSALSRGARTFLEPAEANPRPPGGLAGSRVAEGGVVGAPPLPAASPPQRGGGRKIWLAAALLRGDFGAAAFFLLVGDWG